MWDGERWAAVGEGIDDEVVSLAAHQGSVYASPSSAFGGVVRWTPE